MGQGLWDGLQDVHIVASDSHCTYTTNVIMSNSQLPEQCIHLSKQHWYRGWGCREQAAERRWQHQQQG